MVNRNFSFCAKVLDHFHDEDEALVEYAVKTDDVRLVTSIFSVNIKPDEVDIPAWFKPGAEITIVFKKGQE